MGVSQQPVDGTLDPNTQRLIKELVELEFEIQSDINELGELEGTVEDVQSQNNRIRGKIRTLHKKIKGVKQRAEEQESVQDKENILGKLGSHIKEEESLEGSLRKAHIKCNINMRKSHQKEREELLAGGEAALKARTLRTRRDMLRATEDVTSSLRGIRARMSAESDRGAATLDELGRSSTVIGDTIQEHSSMAGSISRGKGMLNKLRWRETTDRLLILFGVLFFLLVVFYIVKSRLKLTFFGLFPE